MQGYLGITNQLPAVKNISGQFSCYGVEEHDVRTVIGSVINEKSIMDP